MSMTRRGAVGTLVAAAVVLPFVDWDFSGARNPKALASTARLPAPFQRPLPILPVLRPASDGPDGVRYEMTVRQAEVEILPGLKTGVWGYDGAFPGPTLELRRDHPAVLRHHNTLASPIVTHLHGGRTPVAPRLGTTEIWKLTSTERHPVHIHLNPFQVLSRRDGPPGRYDAGWKDTVELTPGDTVEIITRFDGYRGRYLMHCHNLEHEDMAMMAAFDIV